MRPASLGCDDDNRLQRGEIQDDWTKPPRPAAFYGLAGEFVELVDWHSEADRAALLIQFLICFGNVVGRGPYRMVESARHHLNLFAVLVGKSAKSRKGSAWAQVRRLFAMVEPEWLEQRVTSGLSTGEGLINALRDRSASDPGVEDKRLLVIEQEFARVLKVGERKENTLSPVLREAWDSGDLNVLTKSNPARATGAHISVIGHVTQEELKRNLNSTEIANGFANRLLFVAVRRSKLLPFGGNVADEDLELIANKVKRAVEFARNKGRMAFSEKAREEWKAAYPSLSAERDGLVGSIVSRAEAQVLRLACLYAALDCSKVMVRHLKAALALWDYCECSAAFIFRSDTVGDPLADRILKALRSQTSGLTRTAISKLFSGNADSDKISHALGLLRKRGLATSESGNGTGGRPAERWLPVHG